MTMQTTSGRPETAGKKRRVWDEHGSVYELDEKIAEGGQGIVLTTNVRNTLVKLSRWPDTDSRTEAWRERIEALQRTPVVEAGLPIVMPMARIVKPRAGYVMELIDGLVPLESILVESMESFTKGEGLKGFIESGGLARRIRILARLARVLARLHGLGLAHGDVSPRNVFVSTSRDQGEVWLLDCDNLTYAVRDSALQLYTPDYGAPEILRGQAGISTYTDIWSFAVIAFQFLVQIHPFKSGDLVDQDSELEVEALRGELPWVDHCEDSRNRTTFGIDREYVLTPTLTELFDRCFRMGVTDQGFRPSMAEWAEAFEAASAAQVQCSTDETSCGSTFYLNRELRCPFCDAPCEAGSLLRLVHSVWAPAQELGEDAAPGDSWIATGHSVVIGREETQLRAAPPGSAAYPDSPVVATMHIDGSDLLIRLSRSRPVHLQATGTKVSTLSRSLTRVPSDGRVRGLHFGSLDAVHSVWRFKW